MHPNTPAHYRFTNEMCYINQRFNYLFVVRTCGDTCELKAGSTLQNRLLLRDNCFLYDQLDLILLLQCHSHQRPIQLTLVTHTPVSQRKIIVLKTTKLRCCKETAQCQMLSFSIYRIPVLFILQLLFIYHIYVSLFNSIYLLHSC